MIYNFTCDGCAQGEIQQINVPMAEMGPHMYPKCFRCCGETRRLYSTLVFGEHQRSKGIFPRYFDHMGNEPVLIDSRDHLDKEMKKRGLCFSEVSEEVRYRVKKRPKYI